MAKFFLLSGILFSALSVIIGAFGSHGLEKTLQETGYTDTFETAVKYQFYHALALLFIGLYALKFSGNLVNVAGFLMIAGILIFSGSLYLLSVTGTKWLGAITPFGGAAFIAGWIALFISVIKTNFH